MEKFQLIDLKWFCLHLRFKFLPVFLHLQMIFHRVLWRDVWTSLRRTMEVNCVFSGLFTGGASFSLLPSNLSRTPGLTCRICDITSQSAVVQHAAYPSVMWSWSDAHWWWSFQLGVEQLKVWNIDSFWIFQWEKIFAQYEAQMIVSYIMSAGDVWSLDFFLNNFHIPCEGCALYSESCCQEKHII